MAKEANSLAVGPAKMKGFSHITTIVPGTDDTINKLVNQFRKLVDIHELTGDFEKMLALQKLLETFGICEVHSLENIEAIEMMVLGRNDAALSPTFIEGLTFEGPIGHAGE